MVALAGLLVAAVGPAAVAGWDPVGEGATGVSVEVGQDGGSGTVSESGSSSGIQCVYTKIPWPATGGIDLRNPPKSGPEGQWYFVSCAMGADGLPFVDLWVPANQPAVAPAVLAQLARRYLPLPSPGIQTSPAAGGNQVVSVPTWLWAAPATWGQRSATASVPNEAATVVATPVAVTWILGDGSQVVCHGPGTPYRTGDSPGVASPDCGHTYRRSSAGQVGGRYPVSATTTWRITWTATGTVDTAGTLPDLLRTSTTSLRVAEVQTIN